MLLSDHLGKNILVIDLRYIGDCLFLIPLIRNLKLNLPHAKISALVNEGGDSLLRHVPEIHEVIAVRRGEIKGKWGVFKFINLLIEVRKKRFDTVIVVPQSDRPTIAAFASGAGIRIGFSSNSWWRNALLTHKLKYNSDENPHLLQYNLQILRDLGLKIYDVGLSLNIPASQTETMMARFPLLKKRDKKRILVHPGARGYLRQWGASNFAEVINAFSSENRIFLVGGPADSNIITEITNKLLRQPDIVSTDLNLIEFAQLCSLSDLFIGNDSAPIHIAAAVGIFVIGLYGPTMPRFCRPWTDKCLLFDVSRLPCRQCEQDVCLSPKIKACIEEIKPEQVIEGVKTILCKIGS